MDNGSPNRFLLRRVVVPGVCLLAALVLVAYLLLPRAAERFLLPRVFEAAGIRDFDLPVQRWGLFGLQAGTLRIGPAAAPGVSVISLSASYGPGGLVQRRISRLTLEGVRILVLTGRDGGLEIPGLPIPAAAAEGGGGGALEPLPLTVGAIRIKDGEIVVQRDGRRLRLPFEALITPQAGMTAFEGKLKLELAGRWVTANGRIDLAAKHLSADWDGQGIRLGLLGGLAGWAQGPVLSGSAGSSGRLRARLAPFRVDTLAAVFRHTPCQLNWNDIRLDLSGGTSREDLHMRIRNDNEGKWVLETSPIRAVMPGREGLFTLAGSLGQGPEEGLDWQGRLTGAVSVDPLGEGLPGVMLPLTLETTGQVTPDGRWRATLVRADPEPRSETPVMAPGKGVMPLDLTAFEASAQGDRDALSADAHWRMAAMETARGDMRLGIGGLEVTGRYRSSQGAGEGHLALTLAPVTVRGVGLEARLEEVRFEGGGTVGGGDPLQLSGQLSLKGGPARMADPPVAAARFSAGLPVAWPPVKETPAGAFALAAVTWDGKNLGAVAGRLRQTAEGIDWHARHDNRLLPGLTVEANGAAGLRAETRAPFATARWTAERSADAPALMVSDLMPEPPDFPITLRGRLFARGEMSYGNTLEGSLTAGVTAGRLQVDEQGLVVEGLETALHLPDIGHMRSAPAQTLVFDRISFGAVRAEDGQLGFQIEPGGVFFLEGGRFLWCGGTVIAPASRFVPGENRYELTVLCDRLRLDQLLEQLGMAKVEGGGAISGLIPVVLADGLLRFNNAFLYSTPGEGGVIRVQGSEVLTAGIPAGTAQYNQIELARQALKDYEYEWARITMNTVAEDLLVQLQFDGKPANPLPFVYDPAAGGFVKTAPGQPGSLFQGIRLDLNVTLPLNRMLRYRELFEGRP